LSQKSSPPITISVAKPDFFNAAPAPAALAPAPTILYTLEGQSAFSKQTAFNLMVDPFFFFFFGLNCYKCDWEK
jgi:hypothetical protein